MDTMQLQKAHMNKLLYAYQSITAARLASRSIPLGKRGLKFVGRLTFALAGSARVH